MSTIDSPGLEVIVPAVLLLLAVLLLSRSAGLLGLDEVMVMLIALTRSLAG